MAICSALLPSMLLFDVPASCICGANNSIVFGEELRTENVTVIRSSLPAARLPQPATVCPPNEEPQVVVVEQLLPSLTFLPWTSRMAVSRA